MICIDITDRTLKALKHFTEKIAIEITGSISSAAQVKATSLELASNTKVTAQEVSQIRNIVKLISSDLEQFKQGSLRESNIDYGNEETLMRANDESLKLIDHQSEVEKLNTKIKELQHEKEDLSHQIIDIQS